MITLIAEVIKNLASVLKPNPFALTVYLLGTILTVSRLPKDCVEYLKLDILFFRIEKKGYAK